MLSSLDRAVSTAVGSRALSVSGSRTFPGWKGKARWRGRSEPRSLRAGTLFLPAGGPGLDYFSGTISCSPMHAPAAFVPYHTLLGDSGRTKLRLCDWGDMHTCIPPCHRAHLASAGRSLLRGQSSGLLNAEGTRRKAPAEDTVTRILFLLSGLSLCLGPLRPGHVPVAQNACRYLCGSGVGRNSPPTRAIRVAGTGSAHRYCTGWQKVRLQLPGWRTQCVSF